MRTKYMNFSVKTILALLDKEKGDLLSSTLQSSANVKRAKKSQPLFPRYLGHEDEDYPYSFTLSLVFDYLLYGSLLSFLNKNPHPITLPFASLSPSHPSLLSLHWLLNLTSALFFLHSHNLAHGSLSLDTLFLRSDLSLALFDLTNSEYSTLDVIDEFEQLPISFPFDQTDYVSCSEPDIPAQILAFEKLKNIFDLGTVAYILLTGNRNPPQWEMPNRDRKRLWEMWKELKTELKPDVEAVRSQIEIREAEFVRKCWTLGFGNEKGALERMRILLGEKGIEVLDEDDVEMYLDDMEEILQEGEK